MRGKPPFDRVVRDHAATVLRVCRGAVGVDDADDVWSETFLAALKAYAELPSDANIEAWLVTIAYRRSVDMIRARRRRPIPVEQVDERVDDAALRSDTDDPFSRDLTDALMQLPDKQRMSVAYHYLVGLPYKEIADLLGGTPDAARRAAADGIRQLRGIAPALGGPFPKEEV